MSSGLKPSWVKATAAVGLAVLLQGCAAERGLELLRPPRLDTQLPENAQVTRAQISLYEDYRGILFYYDEQGQKTDVPFKPSRDQCTAKRGARGGHYVGAGALGGAVGYGIGGGLGGIIVATAGMGLMNLADFYARKDGGQALLELQCSEADSYYRLGNMYGRHYQRKPRIVEDYNRKVAPPPAQPPYNDTEIRGRVGDLEKRTDGLDRRLEDEVERNRRRDDKYLPGMHKGPGSGGRDRSSGPSGGDDVRRSNDEAIRRLQRPER